MNVLHALLWEHFSTGYFWQGKEGCDLMLFPFVGEHCFLVKVLVECSPEILFMRKRGWELVDVSSRRNSFHVLFFHDYWLLLLLLTSCQVSQKRGLSSIPPSQPSYRVIFFLSAPPSGLFHLEHLSFSRKRTTWGCSFYAEFFGLKCQL